MSREILRALRERAEQSLEPGADSVSVITDAHTDPKRVAVAIARPGASCVMFIDRSEYDGMVIMDMLGFGDPPVTHPTAHARATVAKAKVLATPKTKKLAGATA